MTWGFNEGLEAAGGAVAVPEPLPNPAAFYAALRAPGGLFAGRISDQQAQGLAALLNATAGWPLAHVAYALATPFLETARTMQPIKELGGSAYYTRLYDINGARPDKARELGNLDPGDGAKYCGRGYVQLTGRKNYRAAGMALGCDLEGDPDLAMDPGIAARILVWGMAGGRFTGKSLANYFPSHGPADLAAFTQARRIINGLDRANDIAGYALQFQTALAAGGLK